MNPFSSFARRAKAITKSLYYRADYYLDANKAYILHILSGGSPESRLKSYPHSNWENNKPTEAAKKDRLALFVAYHPNKKPPRSNINYVKSIAACGFRVVYIHNGPLRAEHIAPIQEFCERIICRENIGQDFGAWKDGIIDYHKCGELENLEWLLICNDSNFFISSNQDHFHSNFCAALEKNDIDLIALNKNQELWPHYQSYFLCFHQNIIAQPGFLEFWKRYKPISHRYHAIDNGEIKLTRDVIKNSRALVLYDPSSLHVSLRDIQPSRQEFYSLIPKSCLYLTSPSSGHFNESQPLGNLEKHRALSILELHNPSHALALLFNRYCGSPFLKKDVIKQGVYSIPQIAEILLLLGINPQTEEWEDIMEVYTLQGTNSSYIRYRKQAYRQGINPIMGSRFRGYGKLLNDLGFNEED